MSNSCVELLFTEVVHKNDLPHLPCRVRRTQQLGSVSAATAAARADALAQATKLQSSSRGREAARLAAENKALLEMLSQATDGNTELQKKLEGIRSRYASQVL
jgi:hypothetical protein